MQHEFGGNLPRPHLLIQTHFSSEEEYDIPGQFQFEAKDVIS